MVFPEFSKITLPHDVFKMFTRKFIVNYQSPVTQLHTHLGLRGNQGEYITLNEF